MNEIENENKQIDQSIQEYSRLISSSSITDSSYETLADMLSDFAKSIDSISVEQKRDLIRCLVRRVEWDGETADIVIIGAETGVADAEQLSPQREDSK